MKKTKVSQWKARLVLLVAICLLAGMIGNGTAFAAAGDLPAKGWDRLIGGSKLDAFNDIVGTQDGGTVAVGTIIPNGSSETDGMIVKTNDRGTVLWNQHLGGYLEDGFNSVIELADGSILAAGYARSSNDGDVSEINNGARDGWLIKLDADGNKIWDKLIGGSENDAFADVIATADGGFLAVGNSYSSLGGDISDANNGSGTTDGYITKFDADGNEQWDNLFGSPNFDFFYSVIQTADGGFVAVGNANGGSNGLNTGGEISDQPVIEQLLPNDALIVKFNSSGAVSWHNLFGSSLFDDFKSIIATPDGGFLAAGKAGALDGDITTGQVLGTSTALVAKFDGSGSPQWNRAFTLGGFTYATSLIETPCGNYIVAGDFFDDNDNGFLANISASGNLIGSSITGGAGQDVFKALALGQDRQIIAAGISTSSRSGNILDLSNGGQDGLLVYFGQSRYFVSFEENGGAPVENQVVDYGNMINEPTAISKTGYIFEGWYTDADLTTPFSRQTPIVEDTVLYAKWETTFNTVTFIANGGTATADQPVAFGNLLSEPSAPTKVGYTFAGWYKENTCVNPWMFNTDQVKGNMTLYAKWIPNNYAIKFKGNGANSGTMSTMNMTYNVSKILISNAYKKTGYSFLGWATTSTGPVVYKNMATVRNLTATNKGVVTLYAKWGAPIKSVASAGYNKVKITWSYAGSASSYRIYRATSASGKYTLVYKAKATARSWTNRGLITGKTYFYKVYPVASGKVYKHGKYLYTKPVPATPAVKLTKATNKSIRVAWTGVSGATKYRIFRATGATGKYALVYTASSKARSWLNTGLAMGKTYYYKIQVYHQEGKLKVYGKPSTAKSLKL